MPLTPPVLFAKSAQRIDSKRVAEILRSIECVRV
jgi:hypothetical protein